MKHSDDIILMATADWAHPFWTNKQHTALCLAQLGHRVLYIDTVGTRKIRLNQSKDLKRIWRRIAKLFSPPKPVQHNVWVWSPCLLPVTNSVLCQRLNRFIYFVLLRIWMKKLRFDAKPVYWTYNPLTLLYIKPKQFSQLIYHQVDNIAEQPGAYRELIDFWEVKLLQSAHCVFVTARALEEKAKLYNKNVQYFSNVVDFDHFQQATQVQVAVDLENIPTPRAGFIGAISAYKIDLALLLQAARNAPHISWVLVGEVGEGDPGTNVEQLKALANVYFLGPKKYADLPQYLRGFDVCLIPALINEYTKAMFPMKFFEYLAAAKPIVATDIPAIKEYADYYYVANNVKSFVQGVDYALAHDDEIARQQRQELARQHTYLARTKKMLHYMEPINYSLLGKSRIST